MKNTFARAKARQAKAPTAVAEPNPYLNARRTWNDHVAGVVSSQRAWQLVGLLSLLIALAGVGGITYIGSQSKFQPYVVYVDQHGQAGYMQAAQRVGEVDQRSIHAAVAAFVTNARTITPDVALQKKGIFAVYAFISPNDPSFQKMNMHMNEKPEVNPFNRAQTEMVSVEILSVIPQTPDTWQVDWRETTLDRKGVMKTPPVRMRALITVFTVAPSTATPEEQVRNNPLGIYVRDFSWSKQV